MKLDKFNEIIEFAISREKNAVEFYQKSSEIVKNKAIRDALIGFAEEERRHVKMLEDLEFDRIEEKGIDSVPNLKIGDYLVDMPFNPGMKYNEILILAIKRETAAYNLYHKFASTSTDSSIKKLFTILAQEELKHKNYFEQEYDDQVLSQN